MRVFFGEVIELVLVLVTFGVFILIVMYAFNLGCKFSHWLHDEEYVFLFPNGWVWRKRGTRDNP